MRISMELLGIVPLGYRVVRVWRVDAIPVATRRAVAWATHAYEGDDHDHKHGDAHDDGDANGPVARDVIHDLLVDVVNR